MRPGKALVLVLLFTVLLPGIVPAQSAAPTDTELYLHGLELLVQGNTSGAVVLMRQLLDTYPQSQYVARAAALLEKYGNRLDRSGIVFFYITNLLTVVSLAEALPAYLGSTDSLVLGLSGIAGVGLGIGGSWVLSRDRDLSFGQELWMDTAQLLATVNYASFFDLLAPPGDPGWGRFQGLGAALVATAARAGVFVAVGGSSLPSGQPAFVMLNYVLAYAYTVAFRDGVLKSPDRVVNDVMTIAVPTAAAAAAFLLWDSARWPDYRTGLTVLGALGGGLTGVFADLVIARLVPGIDSRSLFGIAIATAVAGQVLTAVLTEGIPAEEPRQKALSFHPTVDTRGSPGVQVRYSF